MNRDDYENLVNDVKDSSWRTADPNSILVIEIDELLPILQKYLLGET